MAKFKVDYEIVEYDDMTVEAYDEEEAISQVMEDVCYHHINILSVEKIEEEQ